MAQHPIFVPECHADTALMLTLLRENSASAALLEDFVNHQHGIGNVGRVMQERWEEFGLTRRVVGLVDLDKKFEEQEYLRQFTRVVGGSVSRGGSPHMLLQHPARPTQYLVVLNPAFEMWLIARASEIGTTLAAYGLPTGFKAFKQYSRTEGKKPNSQLRRLLQAIATARHPSYAAAADFIGAIMHLDGPLP